MHLYHAKLSFYCLIYEDCSEILLVYWKQRVANVVNKTFSVFCVNYVAYHDALSNAKFKSWSVKTNTRQCSICFASLVLYCIRMFCMRKEGRCLHIKVSWQSHSGTKNAEPTAMALELSSNAVWCFITLTIKYKLRQSNIFGSLSPSP